MRRAVRWLACWLRWFESISLFCRPGWVQHVGLSPRVLSTRLEHFGHMVYLAAGGWHCAG